MKPYYRIHIYVHADCVHTEQMTTRLKAHNALYLPHSVQPNERQMNGIWVVAWPHQRMNG